MISKKFFVLFIIQCNFVTSIILIEFLIKVSQKRGVLIIRFRFFFVEFRRIIVRLDGTYGVSVSTLLWHLTLISSGQRQFQLLSQIHFVHIENVRISLLIGHVTARIEMLKVTKINKNQTKNEM